MLIFKQSDCADPCNTYDSAFESTPGEVTQTRYPVTRIEYLEKFLCRTNKPIVLLKSLLPFTLSRRRQCGALCSNYNTH